MSVAPTIQSPRPIQVVFMSDKLRVFVWHVCSAANAARSSRRSGGARGSSRCCLDGVKPPSPGSVLGPIHGRIGDPDELRASSGVLSEQCAADASPYDDAPLAELMRT